jgi:hypothetical protein
MIDVRKQSDFILHLDAPGTQTAATNKAFKILPFACELIGIVSRLGTAGTTGSQVVDLNKNGTTIFSKAAKITFATTVATPTAFASDETAITAPVQFAEGDNVSFDVDSIHTTPAVNFSLVLLFRRTGVGGVKKLGAAQASGIGTF